jgi:hypothetical protein
MTITTHIPKIEETETERAVQLRAADPGTPSLLQLWLNTSDNKLKWYDGITTYSVEAVASVNRETKAVDYTLAAADDTINVDASAAIRTMTLPTVGISTMG